MGRKIRKSVREAEAKDKKPRKAANPQTEPKGIGRKPTLAQFVDGPMLLSAKHKGKEFSAAVHADGSITFGGKLFTSPSSAGKAACGGSVDGWSFWRFEKDGKMVKLDEIRGKKSPLNSEAAA